MEAGEVAAALRTARELGAKESGLSVVVTTRRDGSPQASVVNAGVLDHPVTGDPVVGFVARGSAMKLVHLRARPRLTVVFRSGWDWLAVEGDVDLAGPDDPLEGLAPVDLPGLLRTVYASAVGGSPEDWAGLDGAYEAERHTAVLLHPRRISSNPAEG